MASNMRTQSSTVRVIGDTVSIVHAKGTTLWLLTRPMVGRLPTIPLTGGARRERVPRWGAGGGGGVRAAPAAAPPRPAAGTGREPLRVPGIAARAVVGI